jgi:lysyl-tRNA synthetase, class II
MEHRYPDSFDRSHVIAAVLLDFEAIKAIKTQVTVAGRLMSKRAMGSLIFFHIQDATGRIQCGAVKKEMDPAAFFLIKKEMKVGDIVGIRGPVFLTKTQEKTIQVQGIEILTKAMRDLPEKYHGLTNQELRYRQRYLDLVMNPEVRKIFQIRSLLIHYIRSFLIGEGFVEVETPTLQKSPCGASANPFKTHHDALDKDFYLRISPETFLKQLIVGGMEKIFEVGKNFRNEGFDPSHLQEFTMLELYVAYWNYLHNRDFVHNLLQTVIQQTMGTLQFAIDDMLIDFSEDWQVVTFRDLVLSDCGIDVLAFESAEDLKAEIRGREIDLGDVSKASLGTLIDKLYKKVSRPKLIQPTFLMNHPATLIPLARLNDDDPRVVDSFQLLVNGWEVVKAYSELADPVLQRQLLEDQVKLREAGDDEAMFLDEDFLVSLEYGMPPVSGLGLGIDRLTCILTGQGNLREVVFFPQMK